MGDVVRRLNPQVSRLVYRLGVSEGDLDDVTQDVWIKVWRCLPGFRQDSSFQTWIYKVAYNTALDHFKRVERHRRTDQQALDEAVASGGGNGAEDDPVADVVVALARRDEIWALLLLLSPRYRAALVLADGEEFRDSEAADILGISTKAFSSRLARARTAMRALLSDRTQELGR